MERRSIVWFRSDLRLHDNQALVEAVCCSDRIIPVYVFDPRVFFGKTSFGFPKTGLHRSRFIIESVEALRQSLRVNGSDLVVRIGYPEEIIYQLALELKTNWVFCNRERTYEEVLVQDGLEKKLWAIGQEMRFERGKMLLYTQDLPFPVTHAPDQFATLKKETEYFVKIRLPFDIPPLKPFVDSLDIGTMPSLRDLGHDDCAPKDVFFRGGEVHGLKQLTRVLTSRVTAGLNGSSYTSRLSPWISQGCLSPKKVYHRLTIKEQPDFFDTSTDFTLALLWRDYYRLMGKKYKEMIFLKGGPLKMNMHHLKDDLTAAESWLNANTGVDIVDACLNELKLTGYLSYKGRVLVANYLVNELGVNWVIGAEYFESLLLDYDPCSNYGNWNQIAGVGVDQTREKISSFSHQEKRLDPDGTYVSTWLNKGQMSLT